MHIAQVLKLLVRVHKMQICSHFSLFVVCNKLILELMKQYSCLNPFCGLCMCVNKLKEFCAICVFKYRQVNVFYILIYAYI